MLTHVRFIHHYRGSGGRGSGDQARQQRHTMTEGVSQSRTTRNTVGQMLQAVLDAVAAGRSLILYLPI